MERNFSKIKERILQHLESVNISKRKFYAHTGISNGVLDKKTGLTEDNIERYISAFPEINPSWLVTGEGSMYLKTTVSEIVSDSGAVVKAPMGRLHKKHLQTGTIKFYDTNFAAGNDVEFHDDLNSITPAYTMDIPEFAGCIAFRTYNDSMEPLIKSGDILFATKVDDWEDGLEYGQIYGITRIDGRRHLKYIRKAKEHESTHFLMRSENIDLYDDFMLAKSKIKNIWLIHGWINKRT
ncbi:S24 family peptidase [Niabella sp. 22666]|uniref:S24 family peptidase n=1 Tax=Niabella sp. 22666 TaxID=3453954 RepID=UPI003F87A0D2